MRCAIITLTEFTEWVDNFDLFSDTDVFDGDPMDIVYNVTTC